MKQQFIQLIHYDGNELKHYVDQDGQVLKFFGPISRVNILVGATNSGKSRFMRGLAKNSPYKGFLIESDNPAPQYILNLVQQLKAINFKIRIVLNPDGEPTSDIPIESIKTALLFKVLKRFGGDKPSAYLTMNL